MDHSSPDGCLKCPVYCSTKHPCVNHHRVLCNKLITNTPSVSVFCSSKHILSLFLFLSVEFSLEQALSAGKCRVILIIRPFFLNRSWHSGSLPLTRLYRTPHYTPVVNSQDYDFLMLSKPTRQSVYTRHFSRNFWWCECVCPLKHKAW